MDMNELQIRGLTKKEIEELHRTQMPSDFPLEEIKPIGLIRALIDDGFYTGYGLFDREELTAYALLAGSRENNWLLLDYYAVCSRYRSSGIGSFFLNALQDRIKSGKAGGILLEIEQISCGKNKEEVDIRTRRKQFYLKNGILTTGVEAVVFDTAFEILYSPFGEKAGADEIRSIYKSVYQTMLPPDLFKKHCLILKKQ